MYRPKSGSPRHKPNIEAKLSRMDHSLGFPDHTRGPREDGLVLVIFLQISIRLGPTASNEHTGFPACEPWLGHDGLQHDTALDKE